MTDSIIVSLLFIAAMFIVAELMYRSPKKKKPDIHSITPSIEAYKKEKRTIRRIK